VAGDALALVGVPRNFPLLLKSEPLAPDNWLMNRGEDRGIVDLSALRMREATIAAGVWLTYAVCGTGALYIALTWQRPHRNLLALLLGAGVVATTVISLLPRERIVRSRFRESFFLIWSLLDLVLIALLTLADGGTSSPLTLVFLVPVVFAALSYPLGSVAAVGALTVTVYLTLALTFGSSSWSYEMMFAVVLTSAGAISAWQARNHERQRAAITLVSRADPLTGCLNRRGFEERAIAEISAAARRCTQGALLLLDIDHFKPVNDRLGHAAGDELLCWVVKTLEKVVRPADSVGRLGGDEFAVLFADIEPADALACAERIKLALSERAPASLGVATFPLDGSTLDELARQADARLYSSRDGRSSRAAAMPGERLSWATTLAHAIDVRMDAEHEHSRAVGDWAVAIASAIGWDAESLGTLRIAATLHDVGMISVPDRVLSKPGALSAGELETIREHSETGAELLAQIDGLETIVPWIRHAHENFDGSGYPDGLSGQAIPQAARILLVADAFDAITNARPYRKASSVAHACAELERHSGTQFDPECVAALLACVRDSVGAHGAGAERMSV
jgi:diguanylate cyclase (GGDEF)-like protein